MSFLPFPLFVESIDIFDADVANYFSFICYVNLFMYSFSETYFHRRIVSVKELRVNFFFHAG